MRRPLVQFCQGNSKRNVSRPTSAVGSRLGFIQRAARIEDQQHLITNFEKQVPTGLFREQLEAENAGVERFSLFEVIGVEGSFQNPECIHIATTIMGLASISAGSAWVPAGFGLGCTYTRPCFTRTLKVGTFSTKGGGDAPVSGWYW